MDAIRALIDGYFLKAMSLFFESNDTQADGRGGRGYGDGSECVGYAIVHHYGTGDYHESYPPGVQNFQLAFCRGGYN